MRSAIGKLLLTTSPRRIESARSWVSPIAQIAKDEVHQSEVTFPVRTVVGIERLEQDISDVDGAKRVQELESGVIAVAARNPDGELLRSRARIQQKPHASQVAMHDPLR